MQYRTLGHTGEKISIVGLGGYHMAVPKDVNESIRIVRTAIDGGINFMDNCWDYHDGESERRPSPSDPRRGLGGTCCVACRASFDHGRMAARDIGPGS